MSKVTYRIKEFNKADPLASLVEKTGHVMEFSMVGVDEHKKQMEKVIKEITGQKTLEEAKMKNIEVHHAFVQKMTDEELHTAHLYWESKKLATACAEKLTQFADQIKIDDAEVAEIYAQCPDLLLTPSPADVVPENAEATLEAADTAAKEAETAAEPVAEAPVEEPTATTQAGEVVPVSDAEVKSEA